MNAAFLVEQLTVAQSGRAYSLRHLREIAGLPVTRLGVSSSHRPCASPDGDAAVLHGLDAAWNAGLRFFDPQRRHFRGTAEHLFGMGLHDRGGQSGSYTVLSRLGTMAPLPGSERDGTTDLKPENLLLQWHANLHRLGSRAAKAAVLEADARWHIEDSDGELHLTAELGDSLQRLRAMKEHRVGKPDEILAVGGASRLPQDDALWLRLLLLKHVDFVVLSGPLSVFRSEVAELLHQVPECSVIVGSPFPGDMLLVGEAGAEEPLVYREDAADQLLSELSDDSLHEVVKQWCCLCKEFDVHSAWPLMQLPLSFPAVVAVEADIRTSIELAGAVRLMNCEIAAPFWERAKEDKFCSGPPS